MTQKPAPQLKNEQGHEMMSKLDKPVEAGSEAILTRCTNEYMDLGLLINR